MATGGLQVYDPGLQIRPAAHDEAPLLHAAPDGRLVVGTVQTSLRQMAV
jgi:hypothetical protein